MNDTMIHNLKILQKKYTQVGFLLIGVFGSYARNDATNKSDLDILYDIDTKFITMFTGWNAINKLEEIKNDIKKSLHIAKVDLASADNNSQVFQAMIKKELIYV